MEASISATKSLRGILDGVRVNFGPFSKSERSEGRSGFLERLTTQLFLSTTSVGKLWEVFKLFSFLSCLALMLFRTE